MLADPPKMLVARRLLPGQCADGRGLQRDGRHRLRLAHRRGRSGHGSRQCCDFPQRCAGATWPQTPSTCMRGCSRRTATALAEAIEIYRGWYAVRFSPYKADDASLFDWCVLAEAVRRSRLTAWHRRSGIMRATGRHAGRYRDVAVAPACHSHGHDPRSFACVDRPRRCRSAFAPGGLHGERGPGRRSRARSTARDPGP